MTEDFSHGSLPETAGGLHNRNLSLCLNLIKVISTKLETVIECLFFFLLLPFKMQKQQSSNEREK